MPSRSCHYRMYSHGAVLQQESNSGGHHFDVRFNVDVQLAPPSDRELLQLPNILTGSGRIGYSYSIVISSQELLHALPRFIRRQLSSMVSDSLLYSIIPDITSYAQSLLPRPRPNASESDSTHSLLFPLFVDFVVHIDPYRREEDDLGITQEVIQQSMQQLRLVPAMEEAVASLIKKVKVVRNEAKVEKCSICLEAFEDGEDVSAMPCDHVYHNQCIIQWLKTSHMCPLCRYQMPVE